MKRWIAFLLALTMVFSLCACGAAPNTNETEATAGGLQIGFGRANITPDFSVNLAGFSDDENRLSTGYVDLIMITCIAVTENDTTLLVFNADNLAISPTTLGQIRQSVSTATGVPKENIMAYAAHSHSTPTISNTSESTKKYHTLFLNGAVESAKAALEDRAQASVYTATKELVNMNAVNHYLLENGTYAGSSFGNFSSAPVKEHTSESDFRLVLVKFDRVDESKQDIVLANWQAHANHAYDTGYTLMSADYPGVMRTKFEKETGMLFTHITGAVGNQSISSKIASEQHNLDMKGYGEALADYAIAALQEMKPAGNSGLEICTETVDAQIDHSWDHMLPQATEVYNLYKTAGKAPATALGETYGFSSHYQARAIQVRVAKPATEPIELHTFRIGEVGFVSAHYEMFASSGRYIRANSPFETTFICSGNNGYIADAAAYDYRSYEADTSMYVRGTGEMLAEKYVEMLKSIQ